jgi:hypothetical protein
MNDIRMDSAPDCHEHFSGFLYTFLVIIVFWSAVFGAVWLIFGWTVFISIIRTILIALAGIAAMIIFFSVLTANTDNFNAVIWLFPRKK